MSPARILQKHSWRREGTGLPPTRPGLPTLGICLESNPFKLNPPFGKAHPRPCGKSGLKFCCPLTLSTQRERPAAGFLELHHSAALATPRAFNLARRWFG